MRVAAGTGRAEIGGETVREVVANACARYGADFASLVQNCRVWRNGEPALPDDVVQAGDEVAILPPVSGG